MRSRLAASPRTITLGLFVLLLLVYNSNGREIGTYDSYPTTLAARAFADHGTLIIDEDVAASPGLARRAPFARDRLGHFRTAYSPTAPLLGAAVGWLLKSTGIADLSAPRAAGLIAALTASILTALAVTLVFVSLRRFSTRAIALAVSIGLGLGTNLWAVASRTLGQHEVVAFGVALAMFSWLRPTRELTSPVLLAGAAGLALATTARFQTTPMAAILLVGLAARVGVRRAAAPFAIVLGSILTLFYFQWRWFGHPLGGVEHLEQLHSQVHAVAGSISRTPWVGAAGILIAPNRGLLIFSPIALIPLFGVVPAVRGRRGVGVSWFLLASLAQFLAYAMYSVWWAGHSFGPRYALDFLLPLAPAAAIALETVFTTRHRRVLCAVLCGWSIAVAATGAFCLDDWNKVPRDVDQHHERLWMLRDSQIVRAWRNGLSPRNFDLLTRATFRARAPAVQHRSADRTSGEFERR